LPILTWVVDILVLGLTAAIKGVQLQFESLKNIFEPIAKAFKDIFITPMIENWTKVIDLITKGIDKVKEFFGLKSKTTELNIDDNYDHSAGARASFPRFATGGTTLSDGFVRIGERGPEDLFLPKGATVKPLDHNSNNGKINININYPTLMNRQAVTELSDMIVDNLRLAGVN
jgi:hypothetical protein